MLPLLDLERPGAVRLLLPTGALDQLLRDDKRVGVDELREKVGLRAVELDLQRTWVEHPDAGRRFGPAFRHIDGPDDRPQPRRRAVRSRLGRQRAVDRVGEVLGRDRVAIGELQTLADDEGVGRAVVADLPAGGAVRLDLHPLVEADQPAEDQADHGCHLEIAGLGRIERRQVADAFERPAQRIGGGRRGSGLDAGGGRGRRGGLARGRGRLAALHAARRTDQGQDKQHAQRRVFARLHRESFLVSPLSRSGLMRLQECRIGQSDCQGSVL